MSGLYPTLEDMGVDKEARAQLALAQAAQQEQQQQQMQQQQYPPYGSSSSSTTTTTTTTSAPSGLYSSLLEEIGGDYLGIDTSPQAIMQHMPPEVQAQMQHDMQVTPYQPAQHAVAVPRRDLPGSQAIAALTPQTDRGLVAGTIRQGVREIVLAKNQDGKLGIAVKAIDKGVFVSFVWSNSAAAMGGLRFGDQILQVNGETVAGYSDSKALKLLKAAPSDRVVLAVRDRPWCRSITLRKDSLNHCGFTIRDGATASIVKDSSAARNGMLINHRVIEINGQNMVGLKDKEIVSFIQASPPSVTVTVMPLFIYTHLVKKIGSSLIKKYMDHSVPEL